MKRGILALAVVGALGSSMASAETFLCRTAPDMSYTACSPIESRVYYMAEPVVVMESQPAVAPRWIVAPAAAVPEASSVPEVSSVTITTHDYSEAWPNTEPRVSTYRYSYGPWQYFYY